MSNPIQRLLRVSFEFEFRDWWNETPFGCLLEEPLIGAVPSEHGTIFQRRAQAVVHKWTMVQIAGAELKVLCEDYTQKYADAAGIPLDENLYLTCKIEAFLMMAKSLLDVL